VFRTSAQNPLSAKKQLLGTNTFLEEDEIDSNGMSSDLPLIKVIEAATTHPKLQVL